MTNILEEDTQFDDQPTPDEIKNYLKERDENEQNGIKPVQQQDGSKLIQFGQDTTFNTSREDNPYNTMHVNIQDDQHQITTKEKEDYLMACLNDELFVMTLDMLRGFTVKCRDLNVYENRVVQQVLLNYVQDNPNTIMSVLTNLLRQCRLPMQIMEICGKPYNSIRFEYDPENASDEKLNEDARLLYKKSMELEMNTPYARYQLCLKALNVFENKLKRLEEASFNENFWKPADHA